MLNVERIIVALTLDEDDDGDDARIIGGPARLLHQTKWVVSKPPNQLNSVVFVKSIFLVKLSKLINKETNIRQNIYVRKKRQVSFDL